MVVREKYMGPPRLKPEKGGRKREKEKQRQDLLKFRHQQVSLAIFRDNSQCAVCFFLHGKRRAREEVHHVYGRGRKTGDWREQHTSLLCVCKAHHPLPIQTPGGNYHLAWVEEVLKQANASPINPEFALALNPN